MADSIIFLDIDGVLNALRNGSLFHQPAVKALNRIIEATGAKIVLSSSWRYMVHAGEMSVCGFSYLLRTHGTCGARVIDVTVKDEDTPGYVNPYADPEYTWCRGDQVKEWLHRHPDVRRFVILDDCEEFPGPLAPHYVQTDGMEGLTEADADRAIAILRGE